MAEVASLLAALKLNMDVDNQANHVTKMKDGSLCQRLAICNLFNLFLMLLNIFCVALNLRNLLIHITLGPD